MPELFAGGNYILPPQILKAKRGEDFFVFLEEGKPPTKIQGVSIESYSYYFKVFTRTESYGLPHGGGWVDELGWVLDFLDEMKWRKRQVEQWHIETRK